MNQAAKLIGLYYQDTVYYAMYLFAAAFDSTAEAGILNGQGLSLARAGKLLLIAPLDRLGGGDVVFFAMPGDLQPREPYLLADRFVRDRWQEILSGAVLNVEVIAAYGLTGFAGEIERYLWRGGEESK